jgi:hypothetical protein
MKQRRTTEELDVLLDRGGLGACRRDDILKNVLAHVGRERPPRSRRRWALAGSGVAIAAAAAALFIVQRRPVDPAAGSAFRAKGTTLASVPSATIECLSGTPAACPIGSLLGVRVVGTRGYVSAWAEPTDGGERIWYFSAETVSPLLDGLAADQPTRRAVKIGPEHRAGTYVVEIRVTDRPLARSALLRLPAALASASGRVPLTVTLP